MRRKSVDKAVKYHRPIRTLLIANRGEIAGRIIRTARDLCIETIAVYSDADFNALHVREADRAVRIGAAPASESYLRGDAIIQAALDTGADAIHPGYGFLSENPEFADEVTKAGLIFIGPSADAMRAMALKGSAKALMHQHGVPVVPGYHGEDQSFDTLQTEAKKIGYPVLIKAVAGGGGKGMRRVDHPDDLKEAIEAAAREGQNSFGNPKLLIEKYLVKPRHIEFQIFGDNAGNIVHLWERDCSIQRRHQKVIEEAPAPGMSDALRKKMGNAAIRAAQAIGYVGAGTVEFIVDVANGLTNAPFYFMEMNTRLQVEHPVTEGLFREDLVEWQIRVAEGRALPYSQEDLNAMAEGHVVEARLYAEDAFSGFLPQTGTITLFNSRPENDLIRVDSAIEAGDEVGLHYDPMIAKIIGAGHTRTEAINSLLTQLSATPVAGLVSNRDFLIRILQEKAFRNLDVSTSFIADHEASLLAAPTPDAMDLALAAAVILVHRKAETIKSDPWMCLDGFSPNLPMHECIKLGFEGETHALLSEKMSDLTRITAMDQTFDLSHWSQAGDRTMVTVNGQSIRVFYAVSEHDIILVTPTKTLCFARLDTVMESGLPLEGPGDVKAPMPGKILDVLVSNGMAVSQDQPLIIMEAMKMEMTLKAQRSGIVEGMSIAANDQVKEGSLLARISAETNGSATKE